MGICSEKNILQPVAALTGAALSSTVDMEVFRLEKVELIKQWGDF